jgi:PIN domain nuclease of toxin-antitoxin system
VKLLLNSHVFLRRNGSPEMISPPLRAAIADPADDIFVSAASVWETAIKRALGKLAVVRRIVDAVIGHRFQRLPITGEQAEYAGDPQTTRLNLQQNFEPLKSCLFIDTTVTGHLSGPQNPRECYL